MKPPMLLATTLAIFAQFNQPVPLDESKHATCAITGAKDAHLATWAGFASSLPDAATKCQSYADTHAGGTCSESHCAWTEAAPAPAKTFKCNGDVKCPKGTCSHSDTSVDAASSGAAKKVLIEACGDAHGDNVRECDGSNLTCK